MKRSFRKGAASFYIVAFSTLILVVIATSFAMVAISDLVRSSNDDLSQSAYDAALAGVEDAKVAFSSYRRCAESGKTASNTAPTGSDSPTCADIMYWVEKSPEDEKCYMVGRILGKIPKDGKTEVTVGGEIVTTGSKETTTNQAYTCVIINTDLNDYRTTLSSEKKIQTMRASVGDSEMNEVKKIRISWYSVRNDINLNANLLRWMNFDKNRNMVKFPKSSISNTAIPPTIEFQFVQTARTFTLAQFDETNATQTNRGTLYLVPTHEESSAKTKNGNNYKGVYTYVDGIGRNLNLVTASDTVKTNDRSVSNKPFLVYCDDERSASSDFYCSVDIEMPAPIGSTDGKRSNNTFMISVSLPYQQPDTDFSIELFCAEGSSCGNMTGNTDGSGMLQAKISNTQISIDSTGRANDLYRRVETRLESADTTFGAGYPYYALQVLGDGGITKVMKVTKEVPFYF